MPAALPSSVFFNFTPIINRPDMINKAVVMSRVSAGPINLTKRPATMTAASATISKEDCRMAFAF